MKRIHIKKLSNRRIIGKFIIFIVSIILIYLLASLYFSNHFFFNTVINGVDVSLKAHRDAEHMIGSYIDNYELQLIERNGETEVITGQSIGMHSNVKSSISKVYRMQNSLVWILSLCKVQNYHISDLFTYNQDSLSNKINKLKLINNEEAIESKSVNFKYSNGCYEVVKEVYGNKIVKDRLMQAIKMNILYGKTKLTLDEKIYYENPKYTLSSDKTLKTKNLLDKYVASIIIYEFGSEYEILDGNIIHTWLKVDENLDVVMNRTAVEGYVKVLSEKYDTVGITRNFKSSIGKIVEVKGGLYGWKINRDAETKAILENLKLGDIIEKEPIYTRVALSRGDNEIGNTYVEINITRQHLWFYKDGKLLAHGSVVTGNPNRGNATVLGTYMLNYKMEGETLSGANYEVKVSYWMPFYGNMGIHDAPWRYSFGGEIYKRNGTHGCVNAPFQLAKTIFENIEEGIPIICYEE